MFHSLFEFFWSVGTQVVIESIEIILKLEVVLTSYSPEYSSFFKKIKRINFFSHKLNTLSMAILAIVR